ncbi:MAG: cytochrome c biogenesis protein CcsA [Schwartzia sp.]|nr:cytochrome c biogenesis protein CcsA [Schwartzia sp. (in: firmicutes)]
MADTAGNMLLGAALLASLATVLLCGLRKRDAADTRLPRRLAFAATLGASALLLWLILADRFEFDYVWSYSAKDLPVVYKVAAFWAGQQGSFLLWLLIHNAAGCLPARGEGPGRAAVAVYAMIGVLLAIMTLARSPFLPAEAIYTDGAGLNPLLQDPWMAIHPPLIFLGYALLAAPLSCSAGALWTEAAAKDWLSPARKWGLIAFAFLGAGIFVGGYWAYKVLGWGGYWGWDPVENSSLVPWLIAAVFLHTVRLAQIRGENLIFAHLAALFAFSFVLYGTFLTRSGLLGDFSVHSFSGTSIGLLLAVINGLLLLAGLLLLFRRAGRLPEGEFYPAHDSREFWTLAGMVALVFIAAVVFIGMSMPLLTQLADAPSAVDTGFYGRTTMPLAVFLLLALTLATLRRWGKNGSLRLPAWLAGTALLGLAAALALGIHDVLPLMASALALPAAAAQLAAWREKTIGRGAAVAHIGVALSLLAMMLSGYGGETRSVPFTPDEPQAVLGHEITYKGTETNEEQTQKYYRFAIDGEETRALTKLRENGEDAAREPAIRKTIAGDVYIAPSPPKGDARPELLLKRGKTGMDENYAYLFEGVEKETAGDAERITAVLSVTDGTDMEEARPYIIIRDGKPSARPVPVFGGKKRLRLTGVSTDARRVRVEVLPSAQEEAQLPVTASVSTKPLIWLLWFGAVLTTAGAGIAVKERTGL